MIPMEISTWLNTEDLLNRFIKGVHLDGIDKPLLEIERKWIVSSDLIEHLEITNAIKFEMLQGYLSVEPELRYRACKNTSTEQIKYYLAYKNNGDLVRTEIESEITQKMALKVASAIRKLKLKEYRGRKFIEKEYWPITEGEYRYQISRVDGRKDFCYMEVEFTSEDEALTFDVSDTYRPYILKEVTNDPSYKMKNYWAKTRLKMK